MRSVPAGRRLEPKGKAHLLEHLQHLAGVRASVNLVINGGEHSVALDIVRRPKATPIHELERYIALQRLLTGARLSVQAEPLSGAAA